MRAAVFTRYGAPDVVRVAEVNKPTVKDKELLVRVHATTVNRTDCGFRAGKPFVVRLFSRGLVRPRLKVLGNEFAGEVVAVGSSVKSFHVGDRVFGFNGVSFGAHAEYMAKFSGCLGWPVSRRQARPDLFKQVRIITGPAVQATHDATVRAAAHAAWRLLPR